MAQQQKSHLFYQSRRRKPVLSHSPRGRPGRPNAARRCAIPVAGGRSGRQRSDFGLDRLEDLRAAQLAERRRRLLAALERGFVDLAAAGFPPVCLAARGRSFCTGLDLDRARGFDRAAPRA